MQALKPCCFCGEAYIDENTGYHNQMYRPVCECNEPFYSEQEAIEQWNKRPNHWITDRLPTDEEQYKQEGSWGVLIKVKGSYGTHTLSGHYDRNCAMWETGGEGFPIIDEVIGWMLWPK